MSKVVEGNCHLCGKPVKVTKYDPPLEGEDEEGPFWLLDKYDCDTCNVEQEHKLRSVKK